MLSFPWKVRKKSERELIIQLEEEREVNVDLKYR